MENTHKRILIIEDSESLVKVTIDFFEVFYGDFIFLNNEPVVSIIEALKVINENPCDVVLLDHQLPDNENGGLEIARKIAGKIKNDNILVLSTSVLVSMSQELINIYRENGVDHFSGKSSEDIKKCIDNECKCHLL